jgi:hypothetical protein
MIQINFGKKVILVLGLTTLLLVGCQPTKKEKWGHLCEQLGWMDCPAESAPDQYKSLLNKVENEYAGHERIEGLTDQLNKQVDKFVNKESREILDGEYESAPRPLSYFRDGLFPKERVEGTFIFQNFEFTLSRCYPPLDVSCSDRVGVKVPGILGPTLDVSVEIDEKMGESFITAYRERDHLKCGGSVSGIQNVIKVGDEKYSGWWRINQYTAKECTVKYVTRILSEKVASDIYFLITMNNKENVPEDWRQYLEKALIFQIDQMIKH